MISADPDAGARVQVLYVAHGRRSRFWSCDLVVVPDPGSHRQDPLGPPDRDALEGPPAVLFQAGRTEGVNARTKRIMRQMHGRAGVDLLRHRILLP